MKEENTVIPPQPPAAQEIVVPEFISECCKAQLKVDTGTEGTSCYMCAKCNKPCIHIPFNHLSVTEQNAFMEEQQLETSKVPEKDFTTLQEEKWHPNLVWKYCFETTHKPWYVINDIEQETEYKDGHWLFIPRTIDGEPEKTFFEIWCVGESTPGHKQMKKRLSKIVRKWNGNCALTWEKMQILTDSDEIYRANNQQLI